MEEKKTEFKDKTMTCSNCGKEFVWTAGEQAFYAEKGFQNEPKKCPECRAEAKKARNNFRNNNKDRY